MKKEKIKNWIIAILLIIIVLLIISIIYIVLQKEKTFTTTGKIISGGTGYIIIESEENDYIYETENEYTEGTILKLDIQSTEKNSTPILIKKGTITILEEPKGNSYMSGSIDIKENSTNQIITEENEKTSPNQIIEKKENLTNENPEQQINSKDEMVISYLNEISNYSEDKKNESIIKNGFITITDFLFYNGDIKGVTLKEITAKTKLTVLQIALKIDAKVDSYFPDYKEKITSTTSKVYTGIKNKIIETYLNTTTKICNQNETLCEDAKRDFNSMKTSFGISWNLIKDLASSGVGNLKEWYEIYSGKK